MANVAAVLHFSAVELWDMDVDELLMWHTEAMRIAGKTPS